MAPIFAPIGCGRYRRDVPATPHRADSVPAVTLQFFGISGRHIPRALWRMAADRRGLQRTRGLRFFKLFGTGDGRTFDLRDADLRTWGVLTVWDDPAARQRFLHDGPTVVSWRAIACQEWRVDLRPVRSIGTWAGADPFSPPATPADAPLAVAAITRGRLRPRKAVEFWRAVPPVTAALGRADGLLTSIGIGEAPIGLQATFSVWRDERALRDFAYRTAAHRGVIDATAQRRWYAEDLFARFDVVQAEGSLHGVDPLAGSEKRIR